VVSDEGSGEGWGWCEKKGGASLGRGISSLRKRDGGRIQPLNSGMKDSSTPKGRGSGNERNGEPRCRRNTLEGQVLTFRGMTL